MLFKLPAHFPYPPVPLLLNSEVESQPSHMRFIPVWDSLHSTWSVQHPITAPVDFPPPVIWQSGLCQPFIVPLHFQLYGGLPLKVFLTTSCLPPLNLHPPLHVPPYLSFGPPPPPPPLVDTWQLIEPAGQTRYRYTTCAYRNHQ